MAAFTFKLAAVGSSSFVATLVWLPPDLRAEVTAGILLLVLVAPVLRRCSRNVS
jgi:hypothetical protein